MAGDLDFLLQHGMSLDEIHRLMDHDGFTLGQITESARRIVGQGGSLKGGGQKSSLPDFSENVALMCGQVSL